MAEFRCKRFPEGTRYINTTAGRVVFVDGEATVDDPALAAALREVPDSFQISEIGTEAKLQVGERVVPRSEVTQITWTAPAPRDNKAAWVDWAVHNGADRAEADAMTKKDLIAAFG